MSQLIATNYTNYKNRYTFIKFILIHFFYYNFFIIKINNFFIIKINYKDVKILKHHIYIIE